MWFTLFFVPLFPVSRKHVIEQCSVCRFEHGDREDEARLYQTIEHHPRGLKRCSECGAEVPEDARFCQHCGHRFG